MRPAPVQLEHRPPGQARLAALTLAAAALVTGCVRDFRFDVPETHPAHPAAGSAGSLTAPSPYDGSADSAEGSEFEDADPRMEGGS